MSAASGGGQDRLPETGPGSRTRRRWFLSVSAVLLVAALVLFRGVLLPFLLAIVLAYVLSPVVSWGERLRVRQRTVPRWVVVVALYTALIGALSAFLTFSVPRLAGEFARLTREAPLAVSTVRTEWLPELERRLRSASRPYLEETLVPADGPQRPGQVPEVNGAQAEATDVVSSARPQAETELTPGIIVRPRQGGGYDVVLPEEGLRVVPEGDRAYRIETAPQEQGPEKDITSTITEALGRTMDNTEQMAVALLQAAQKLVGALTRGIFGFVMMLMISAYLLVTSDRIFGFLRSLWPPGRRDGFDDLVRRMDGGLAGVVRGQLIICAVNGVLSGIGFYLLGLKYWTFLTLLAGVMSIIPIFGSILSTIPAVLVALPQGLDVAALVIVWIVGIHQIEANLLNPKIMGDSARVHPVLVVFALLAGEHVAGIMGALLAVPVLSITQTLFLFLRERFLGVPRTLSVPPSPPPAASAPAEAGARTPVPGAEPQKS
ncbi:MAG: AI-2E family transporter [Myxococcales bacterium]|nr:AI-2E family transporter [Myxococcales bacterium]